MRRRSCRADEEHDGDAGRDRVGRDACGRAKKTCETRRARPSAGGQRTKGRAGRCSWPRAARWLAARCESPASRDGAPGMVSLLHTLHSLRRREAQLAGVAEVVILRTSTSAVRVCTARRLGPSEGSSAQRAGRRRSCGSGQGLGVGTWSIALEAFKLTNGRRAPLFGGLRAV